MHEGRLRERDTHTHTHTNHTHIRDNNENIQHSRRSRHGKESGTQSHQSVFNVWLPGSLIQHWLFTAYVYSPRWAEWVSDQSAALLISVLESGGGGTFRQGCQGSESHKTQKINTVRAYRYRCRVQRLRHRDFSISRVTSHVI